MRRRIWPIWMKTVGAMISRGVIVRVGCARCQTIFDVDLKAIAARRGAEYSLLDREVQCKVTSCRGQGLFLAANDMESALVTLINVPIDPLGIERKGLRPIDLEPPPGPYGAAPAAAKRRA